MEYWIGFEHHSSTPSLQFVMNSTSQSDTLWRDLSPLMNPRSVAIVGASQRTDALPNREPRGNRVIRNLKNFGYPGRIVAINPKYMQILWTESLGRLMIAIGLVSMAFGAMIIRKIVAFKG